MAMMVVANGDDRRLDENRSEKGIGTNRQLELPHVRSFEICLLDDTCYFAVPGRNIKPDFCYWRNFSPMLFISFVYLWTIVK